MELRKSHWTADGNNIRLSMPIAKVDEEKRLVSGFATLDNIDAADDVVLASASASAFARFRGNIREMHQPIAAGRLVDFQEDSFYDSNTKEFYRGVYVTVYVSKGAQDTWEKVLDGTLSGFSIGGNIIDASSEFVKDAGEGGKTVRFIKEYDLVELSLVDNPCNQLANVFSIQKSGDSTLMKGMVADTELINVFWCSSDEIAKHSTSEAEACKTCGGSMEIIGWFEKGEDESAKVADVVSKFLRQGEDDVADNKQVSANGEGGVEMADEIEKNAEVEETATEEVVEETPAEVEEVASEEEVVEQAAEVEEAAVEPDFEKMFDDLKDSVKDSIEKTVQAVEQKVSDVVTEFEEKTSELTKNFVELSEKLDSIKHEREDVAKRLDALESATAIKKSGEVEKSATPEKKMQKGLWSGTFFVE